MLNGNSVGAIWQIWVVAWPTRALGRIQKIEQQWRMPGDERQWRPPTKPATQRCGALRCGAPCLQRPAPPACNSTIGCRRPLRRAHLSSWEKISNAFCTCRHHRPTHRQTDRQTDRRALGRDVVVRTTRDSTASVRVPSSHWPLASPTDWLTEGHRVGSTKVHNSLEQMLFLLRRIQAPPPSLQKRTFHQNVAQFCWWDFLDACSWRRRGEKQSCTCWLTARRSHCKHTGCVTLGGPTVRRVPVRHSQGPP